MFSAADASATAPSRRSSSSLAEAAASAAAAVAAAAASTAAATGGTSATATAPAAAMTNEEMFAHQLDLHKKIQEQMQQQLQLQKEMSLQMGQKPSSSSTGAASPLAPSATTTATPSPPTSLTSPPAPARAPVPHLVQQQQQIRRQQSSHASIPPPPPPSSPPLSPPLHRQSLSAAVFKIEPDLGDNVFDMLDDLIMIPSGAVAPERNSLSNQPVDVARLDDHDHDDPNDDNSNSNSSDAGNNQAPGSGRDSLADILESLDMDLEDFDMMTTTIDVPPSSTSSSNSSNSSRSSIDEEFDGLDDLDLDLDFDDDSEDHGIDDDDDDSDALASIDTSMDAIEDYLDPRRSSFDLMASSIAGSSSGSITQSAHGNLCTLVWEGGLLGIRVRLSQSRMLPAVSKLTGRSAIVGIHLVDVGDLLIQIGTRQTREMDFLDAIAYLKDVEKPCQLVFRRLTADPMAVKTVQPLVTSAIARKLALKFEELASDSNDKANSQSQEPAGPIVKLDAKYEVKWLDGPLGISLIASKDVPYPLVTRITGKNRSPQVQDVQPGHYLVQIGSYNTADGNFNTAIKFLQKVTKPVSLFFCPGNKKLSVRPDVAADEYDHVWEKKQALCFTVKPDDVGRMVIADLGSAKSIKVKANKNAPNLAAFVMPGDRLEWINDDHTVDLTFHEALLKLRTAKRPLVIRFKKPPPPPLPSSVVAAAAAAVAMPADALVLERETRSGSTSSANSSSSTAPAPAPATNINGTTTAATAKPVATSRSFNPLKKIAALSSYAKENAINNANARGSEGSSKKSPPTSATTAAATTSEAPTHSATHSTQTSVQSKIALFSTSNSNSNSNGTTAADVEVKRNGASHDNSSAQASTTYASATPTAVAAAAKATAAAAKATAAAAKASASATESSSSATTDSSSSHPTHTLPHRNSAGEPSRREPPPTPSTKLLNIETLNGIRKTSMSKASSDPSMPIATTNERVAAHAPLKPLTLDTRHHHAKHASAATGAEEPVPTSAAASHYKPHITAAAATKHEHNPYTSPLPTTYTGEEGEVYEVVWPEGTALGLTLRVHPTTRFPVVARVTGTSNLRNIEHVAPGDVLFAANGQPIVPQTKFKQTLDNLSKLPKPAHLRFRRSQSIVIPPSPSGSSGSSTSSASAAALAAAAARLDDPMDKLLPRGPTIKGDAEYEFVWRENANLGLVFSSVADVPKVTKVDVESGGPIISRVSVGDVLTWIGPLGIQESSFHQSMATLRAVKRPVVLRFKRGHP